MTIDDRNDVAGAPIARRALLKLAAGASIALALPAAVGAASRAPVARAAAAALPLGCWSAGTSLERIGDVRAGWMAPCASRTSCAATLDDELRDARGRVGNTGAYRVRVLGLASAGRAAPFRLVALHGSHEHEAWSAWRAGSAIATSSPVAVAMQSQSGVLPFLLHGPGASRLSLSLPAQRGVYVAALDGTRMPWRKLALVARDPARPLARELAWRSGASFDAPYLMLAVAAST